MQHQKSKEPSRFRSLGGTHRKYKDRYRIFGIKSRDLIPSEDKYTFIGGYLHGFMDGEAVTRLETGAFTISDFV
jgi:hypothetical protein